MKLNYKRTLLTGLAFMSIMCFWQMYDNIIPLILKDTFHMNEVITGAIMAADNVLAVFLLPFFGTWSDKVDTKLGKRIPFVLVGTLLAVASMIFMPIADNSVNLVLFLVATGCVLLSMSVFRSPAVALMPDVTPRPLRSRGNAIVNLMGTLGAIYALIMIKVAIPKEANPNYMPLFLSIIGFMIVTTAILGLTVKENKWTALAREAEKEADVADEGENEKTGEGIKLDKPKMRSLIFLLFSVALWYMAYNAVTTAFSRYATQVWGLEGGGYADCLMVATVSAVICYLPLGMLAAKIGRKKSILIGVIGLIVGFAFGGTFTTYSPLINIAFVLIGISWAAINVNSFPMTVEIASDADVGKYTGYYYTFSMVAQVLTPILSGLFLQYVSYKTLFPYAVVFSILAFITMLQVKHGDII